MRGDDFISAGLKEALGWSKTGLQKKYELKEAARLGPGTSDDKEGRVLNRIVRWEQEKRHPHHHGTQCTAPSVAKIVASMGLERCRHMGTPGTKPGREALDKDESLTWTGISSTER